MISINFWSKLAIFFFFKHLTHFIKQLFSVNKAATNHHLTNQFGNTLLVRCGGGYFPPSTRISGLVISLQAYLPLQRASVHRGRA